MRPPARLPNILFPKLGTVPVIPTAARRFQFTSSKSFDLPVVGMSAVVCPCGIISGLLNEVGPVADF